MSYILNLILANPILKFIGTNIIVYNETLYILYN